MPIPTLCKISFHYSPLFILCISPFHPFHPLHSDPFHPLHFSFSPSAFRLFLPLPTFNFYYSLAAFPLFTLSTFNFHFSPSARMQQKYTCKLINYNPSESVFLFCFGYNLRSGPSRIDANAFFIRYKLIKVYFYFRRRSLSSKN